MQYIQQRNLLFAPDATGGGGAPAATATPAATSKPAQPSATPSPAASAPAASAPPPAVPAASDDPFERPRKPATTPAAKAAPVVENYDQMPPKDLRDRVKTLREQTKTQDQKIAEYERRIESLSKSGQDTSALTTRLTQLEKERDERDATIRALKQEASPEFIQKWDKPFKRYATSVQAEVEKMTLIVHPGDPESGTPPQTRPATFDDFIAIYQMPTQKAIAASKAAFGEASQWIMNQRDKLIDMQRQKDEALDEERTQFKEKNAKETAEATTRNEQVKGFFQQTMQRLSDSNDDYKVDPTDTEAVEARNHALQTYDTPVNITDETSGKAEIARRAHIRLKIGAYPVMKLRNERLKEENENLKAQVAELKGGSPGNVRRPGGDQPAASGEVDSIESWMKEAKNAVPA